MFMRLFVDASIEVAEPEYVDDAVFVHSLEEW